MENIADAPRIKVLDLSTHWSGSVASRHLAHLGADVVKVENPSIGDGNRALAPLIAGQGLSHLVLNAGKRSVTIDRRSPEWEQFLEDSSLWADVVILGSQPGVAARRGLDFESFVRRNDQIIYCNISGYGEIGPWADFPLHGLNGDVAAGLTPIEFVDGLPEASPNYRSVGTTLAGIHAAIGILEALRRRDHGGGAQRVSASVWESSMFWQWRDLTNDTNLKVPMSSYADLGSRYAMYETSDSRIILVCPIERKFWTAFCDVLGLPEEWKSVGSWGSSGMDWGKARREERIAIAEKMRQRAMDDWIVAFEASGIPFSPLYRVEEAASSDHAQHLAVMASITVDGNEVRIPNVPLHVASVSASREHAARGKNTIAPPPELGEHTEEFLEEIARHH